MQINIVCFLHCDEKKYKFAVEIFFLLTKNLLIKMKTQLFNFRSFILCLLTTSFSLGYAQQGSYTTDGSKITLTTSRENGSWELVVITNFLKPGYDGKTWIDWNSNGKYDEQEQIYTGPNIIKHTQSSKTITVYGDVKYFLAINQELTSIDVTECPSLSTLNVSKNKLTSLNLTNLDNIKYLHCNNNELTELDFSNKQKLYKVSIFLNNLSQEAFKNIAEAIVDRSQMIDGKEQDAGNIYVVDLRDIEKNICSKEVVDKMKSKKWVVYAYPDYSNPDEDEIEYDGYTTDICTPNSSNSQLEVYPNPVNKIMNIEIPEKYIGHTMNIISINGSVVATYKILQTNTAIDVSTIPMGKYIIRVGNMSSKIEVVK